MNLLASMCQYLPHHLWFNILYQCACRRISIQAAWLSKLSEHMEWAGPVDQMVTHMRYGVAAVLLVAALAVFTSTFILPHTRLGS